MRTFDYDAFRKESIPSDVRMYLTLIAPYKDKQAPVFCRKSGVFENLAETARIRSAGASNRIDGIETTDKRLIAIVEGKIVPHSKDEKEILGYSYCFDKICADDSRAPVTPDEVLALHADLYQYYSSCREGRFKVIDHVVETMPSTGEKSILFVPPPAVLTPQAMEDLCTAYNRAIEDNVLPPLILIMQFVFDFLCIHPFDCGNGRMSRLLTLLLLNRSGFPVIKYISIESMIEKTKDSYFDALNESASNWHEGKEVSWPFVRYMLGILLAAYREIENRAN